MPPGKQPVVQLETRKYLGVDTANQFSQIPPERSPSMQNAWAPKLGSVGKRPGSAPITQTALSNDIEYITTYKTSADSTSAPEIYAASGTTLYKFDGVDTLDALTMTDSLNQADITSVGFTDADLDSVLVIGDGADLKQCDGTTVVDITPASDDPSPNPANVLLDINAKGCRYVWTYSRHVFISPGTNEVFYSKRNYFDYFPETSWFLLIRDNDFVVAPGLAFDDVCLIPMRRGWGILRGSSFDDFEADTYLNTTEGVIARKSIQKVIYPNGEQTIIYLSDSGIQEVFTAVYQDTSRLYATRDLMKDRIDFEALNLTESEKEEAVGFFDKSRSLYLLSFKQNGTNITYAYDLRTREWYLNWLTFNAKSYVSLDSITYFAGELKHLCSFDNDLYSDWEDKDKTTGTPIHFKRYSPLLSLEFSGYASYWDYYLVECRQFLVPASLDITVVFGNSSSGVVSDSPWKLTVAVYGVSRYGEARYANLLYTDIVNAPNRKVFKKKAKYVQVLWENDQDQPLQIFRDLWIGRSSGQ